MNLILQVLKEQIENTHLILRLAAYETKSKYQMHYLGILWQFLNPVLQVGVFWFVFGLGIRGGAPVEDTPFFVWLIIGLIPWFFLSPTIIQASNSVYTKVNLVAKMKFPVSVLPTVVMVGNSLALFVMLIFLVLILLLYGIYPNIYWLQLPYYLFCLYTFIYAFSLFNSTVSTIVRDYQLLLQSIMRMFFFLTPIFWVPDNMPEQFQSILKLNPFYYLIGGFRNAFLGQGWFFNEPFYMLYFWLGVSVLLFIGAVIHIKFRKSFVDYL
jgi:teichoic acid transport system permease protein